jgi:hypothetical protein
MKYDIDTDGRTVDPMEKETAKKLAGETKRASALVRDIGANVNKL